MFPKETPGYAAEESQDEETMKNPPERRAQ